MHLAAGTPELSCETAAVLSGLPEGVMVTDLATERLVFANELAARLAGFDSPEALLNAPRDQVYARVQLLDEQGAPLAPEVLPPLRAMGGERPPPVELRTRGTSTQSEEWATMSAFPLLGSDGRVRQVVTLLHRTTERHRAERALRFLVKATEVLDASLDYQRTLQALARLAVPELADGCSIHLREDDGSVRRLFAHADPEVEAQLRELWQSPVTMRPDAPAGPAYVLRTGKPVLIPEYTDELLQRSFATEEAVAKLKSIGYRSSIAVPLVARGQLIGSLSLFLTRPGRAFDEADLSLATELGSRAARAIDNARLYREAQAALARKDEEVRESERLRRLGNAMVAELDPARLLQLVIQEVAAACGAGFAAFVPRGEGAGVPVCAHGISEEALASLPRERIATVLDEGEVLSVPELPAGAELAPGLPPTRSLLVVPVRAESGRTLGALVLGHSEPRVLSERQEQLALAVAAQASIALANARHVQRAREAEAMSRANEERLRLALGAGRMGYFDVDLQTGMVGSSPELDALMGAPAGTFSGDLKQVAALIHPEDREAALGALRRLREAGAPKGVLEFRLVSPAGSIHWIEAHVRLIRDEVGTAVREIGFLLDVTARKEAEAQAQALARAQAARAEAEAAQQRITAILESIAEPFFAVDRDWRLLFANQRTERLMGGRKREALLHRDIRELFPGETVKTLIEQCARAFEGELVKVEQEIADGRCLEVRASAFDQGLSIYVRDVTDRRREQEAMARRSRYEALRADVGAALARKASLDEMLRQCSDALALHLELAVASIWLVNAQAGTLELRALTVAPGRQSPAPHIRELPLDGSHLGMLVRERRPFVTHAFQELSLFSFKGWAVVEGLTAYAGHPLLDGDEAVGALALFSDRPFPEDLQPVLNAIGDTIAQGIERRHAEQALALRAVDLARSNAELEQFAYVASHDLQEPLRMVASYVQLLARRYKGKLGPDADEFIQFAVQGATRMKRLIGDLLAYSRVGTRGRPFAPVRCDAVLARVLTNLEDYLQESGAQVTSDPLPEVQGDAVQLEQLFQHLIDNAVKFHGATPPRIHVSAERRQGEWVFSVKDNGIGIAPQDIRRLFVIFQRLHGPMEYPGTGIGLALCKKIVERHGGRIWLESTPGQGTTCFFTLGPGVAAKA